MLLWHLSTRDLHVASRRESCPKQHFLALQTVPASPLLLFLCVYCNMTHESPLALEIRQLGATLISCPYPNISFNSNRHAGAHKLELNAGQDVWFPIRPYPEQ